MDLGIYGQEEETQDSNYILALRLLPHAFMDGVVWLKENDITGGALAITIYEDGRRAGLLRARQRISVSRLEKRFAIGFRSAVKRHRNSIGEGLCAARLRLWVRTRAVRTPRTPVDVVSHSLHA